MNKRNLVVVGCALHGGASAYTNTLLAQGITVRTLSEFTTGELSSTGFPLIFAKRVFKAARKLPDYSADDDAAAAAAGRRSTDALYVDGTDGCLMDAAALDELDSLFAAESKKNILAGRLAAVGKAGGGGRGRGKNSGRPDSPVGGGGRSPATRDAQPAMTRSELNKEIIETREAHNTIIDKVFAPALRANIPPPSSTGLVSSVANSPIGQKKRASSPTSRRRGSG